MLCRHCQKVRSNRPRGLCWSCYYKPGVREKYPSTSKYARRGLGNFNGNAPLPDTTTDAAPGSEEKIRILMERAGLKQALFHPEDTMYERADLALFLGEEEPAAVANEELAELRDAG